MYTPKHFGEEDINKLHALIERTSFGILVNLNQGRMQGTHLPFVLKKDAHGKAYLVAHIARANDAHKHLDGEVLVIFQGPHAFISPTWYGVPNHVPTWNYVAAHVYGKASVIDDFDRLGEMVDELTELFDPEQAEEIRAGQSEAYRQGKLPQIVGMQIEISEIQGKFKLNQNRTPAMREGVITQLEAQGDPDSLGLAQEMRRYYDEHKD